VFVGCAFGQRQEARECFEEVLAWYSRTLGLIERPGEWSARLLSQPLTRSDIFAGTGNVMLAGEAAGLVSPSSGEGISFALSSGAGAGRAVASASPDKAHAEQFKPLARRVMVKTVKARIIYSPAARSWALRLPWRP
jgi:geranylgeranyl reductase